MSDIDLEQLNPNSVNVTERMSNYAGLTLGIGELVVATLATAEFVQRQEVKAAIIAGAGAVWGALLWRADRIGTRRMKKLRNNESPQVLTLIANQPDNDPDNAA